MEIHIQHCYTNELSSKILKKKCREIFKLELSINRLAMADMLNNNMGCVIPKVSKQSSILGKGNVSKEVTAFKRL